MKNKPNARRHANQVKKNNKASELRKNMSRHKLAGKEMTMMLSQQPRFSSLHYYNWQKY